MLYSKYIRLKCSCSLCRRVNCITFLCYVWLELCIGNGDKQKEVETLTDNIFDRKISYVFSQQNYPEDSFISNLSYDRSTASSKTIPPLNAI
jgi:hypothetical protein